MTKDVYITVQGSHIVDGTPQEPVVTKARGKYYYRGGKHYLLYDEELEGVEQPISSVVKFNDTLLEVRKKGSLESLMVFEKDKLNVARYATGAGTIEVGMKAADIALEEAAGRIRISVTYEMFAGCGKVQDSRVTITAVPYPFI